MIVLLCACMLWCPYILGDVLLLLLLLLLLLGYYHDARLSDWLPVRHADRVELGAHELAGAVLFWNASSGR